MFTGHAAQCDLNRRVVKEGAARMWAEAKGFHYFETSAETGQGINELFERIVELAVPRVVEGSAAARAQQTFTQEDLDEVQRSAGVGRSISLLTGQDRACPVRCGDPWTCSRAGHEGGHQPRVPPPGHHGTYVHARSVAHLRIMLSHVQLHPDKNHAPGSSQAFESLVCPDDDWSSRASSSADHCKEATARLTTRQWDVRCGAEGEGSVVCRGPCVVSCRLLIGCRILAFVCAVAFWREHGGDVVALRV